ncbi:trub family pseudouridylate synthase-containing protein [Phyllosticta citrichinensis]|uniref:tRNA pseudouridine(55) synthase n=1 Tax=Phyllosticta citrichinensis TaxID=1130410 RepID=A0ABR1XJE2_9PEZI
MARVNAPHVLQGVFAINKPTIEKPKDPMDHMSSQKVLDEISAQFNSSSTFQPLLEEQQKSVRDWRRQNNRRPKGPNRTKNVKIGHGGTLDPLATGILVVGIGNGTKSLSQFLGGCSKTYEATVLFGATSDSFDVCGKILKRGPYGHITKELIEKTLDVYHGKYTQKPPIFSAIKVNGKKMYEYAREGKEIPDLDERPVEVSELELLEFMPGGTHGQKYILENASAEPEAPEEMKANADKLVEASLSKITREYRAARRQEEPADKPTDDATASQDLKRKHDGEQDLDSEPPTKKTHADDSASTTAATTAPDTTSTPSSTVTDGTQAPAARIRITASSGFYVRSFIHELAVAMDSIAVMTALKRTKQAHFELGKNVLEWDELKAGEQVWGPKVRQYLWEWMDAEESNGDVTVREQGASREWSGKQNERKWSGRDERKTKRESVERSWEKAASPPRNQGRERRSKSPERRGEAPATMTQQRSSKTELDDDDDWGDM